MFSRKYECIGLKKYDSICRRTLLYHEPHRNESSSSVYSPFSNRVVLLPQNTPFLGVLMKSNGAAFLPPDAISEVNHMCGMQ